MTFLRHRLAAAARLSLTAAACALALPAVAPAQDALERNRPPRAEVPGQALAIDNTDYGAADPTPLGVDIAGISLIGQDEPVGAGARPGIRVGAVPAAPRAALQAALRPWLGRPLSLEQITRIQGAIAQVYRDAGYPFVSVTIPPQEVTTGTLTLRVIEFRMGEVRIAGAERSDPARVRAGIRAPRGGRIDATALEQDLSWLNRILNRRAEAVFAPGESPGLSDLKITLDEGRPVQGHAGVSTTGASDTGHDRWFVGVDAWFPALGDTTLAYQITGSSDAWKDPAKLIPETGDFARYVSHSARLVLPTGPRQALEIAPNFVASRQPGGPFITFENTTLELPVTWRSALSNLFPGAPGDIGIGIASKQLHRRTFFGNFPIATAEARLIQVSVDWNHRFVDAAGFTDIDLALKAGPAEGPGVSSPATWAAFSNGRLDDAGHAYLGFSIRRQTRLSRGWSISQTLSGQFAGRPLPDSERIGLGGLYATRGYFGDDGSADSGLVIRNELRMPPLSPGAAFGAGQGGQDLLSPFLFADAGIGKDHDSGAVPRLASVGAGFDYEFGQAISSSVVAAWTLRDAAVTQAGDFNLQARLLLRF